MIAADHLAVDARATLEDEVAGEDGPFADQADDVRALTAVPLNEAATFPSWLPSPTGSTRNSAGWRPRAPDWSQRHACQNRGRDSRHGTRTN